MFSSNTQRNAKTTITTPQVEKETKSNVVHQIDNDSLKDASENIFATIG